MAKYFHEESPMQEKDDSYNGMEGMEADMRQDVDDLAQSFRDRMKAETKRHREVTDSNYYFTVCFTNQEQMNEFLTAMGFDPYSHFISGKKLAAACNRAIQTPDTRFPKTQAFNKDYLALAKGK